MNLAKSILSTSPGYRLKSHKKAIRFLTTRGVWRKLTEAQRCVFFFILFLLSNLSTCQNCQPHMLCKETQRGRDALWYHLPPVNSLMVMHPLLPRPATATRPFCGTRWAHQTFYHRILVLSGDRADERSVVPPILWNVFGSTDFMVLHWRRAKR